MRTIGPGVREIRVRELSGAFRVVYIATFIEAVYVLHAFAQKDATHIAARHRAGAIAVQGVEARSSAMKKQQFDSVWDAIEPSRAEAANMKARAELMIAIQRSRSTVGTHAGCHREPARTDATEIE